MKKYPRFEEYKVLTYRILLAYVFYSIARILFYLYNHSLINVDGIVDLLRLCYHGLVFDTTAILYVNSLFIIVSIFPTVINVRKGYQKMLFYIYFITNLLAYSANYIDFIYYRYTFSRSTRASLDTLENESNKTLLLLDFLKNYWHVFLLFFIMAFLWIWLYKKVKIVADSARPNIQYFFFSVVSFLLIVTLCIGGIRGDFKKSTRPINILDASRYTKNSGQAD
ncbi:MAG TPA: LTA synthase family protein, partial [Flavobacterium sp.]|nr:LTA synthase family protein [Flavobacterium sp.]